MALFGRTAKRAAVAAAAGFLLAFSALREPATEGEAREPAPAPAPPHRWDDGETVEVSGRLLLLDASGRAYEAVDGSMEVLGVEVPVRGGAWRARVPRGVPLLFSRILLGGRRAYAGDCLHPVPTRGTLVVRARAARPSRLRVLDDATGAELRDVEVVRNRDWRRDGDIHPAGSAERERVAAGAASPVALPDADDVATFWARAPGRAWGRVEIDHRAGGDRALRLPPGGSLEIVPRNLRPGTGTVLRLRREGAASRPPCVELPAAPGRAARLDGLPEGAYVVSAEIGDAIAPAATLAATTAVVRADGVARVRFVLAEPPAPPALVPLAGTLAMADAWISKAPRVRVERLEPSHDTGSRSARLERVGPGFWLWDAGPVPAGAYAVAVDPTKTAVRVDVGPYGERTARIEVADPADVEVRVLDAATGWPARARLLGWSPACDPRLPSAGAVLCEPAGERGVFRFRAPIGAIRVTVWTDAATKHDAGELAVAPGANRRFVHVAR